MELPELSELYNHFEIPDFEEWRNAISLRLNKKGSIPFASNFTGKNNVIKSTNTEAGAVLLVGPDSTLANKEILYLLSQGIQGIEVSFVKHTNLEHLDILLKDVIIDYIQIFWNVDDSDKGVIETYWSDHALNVDKHTFMNSDQYIHANDLQTLVKGDNVNLGKSCLNVEVYLGTDYIQEVARLRAIHCYMVDNAILNYRLIAKFKPSSDLDNDTRKIANTVMAMAAMVGGCAFAFPYDHQENMDEVRLASNVFQVLKFESKLEIFSDPLAGSYMVEELTSINLSSIKSAV